MRRSAKAMVAVAGGTVGSTAAAVAFGRLLWDRATAREVRRLVSGAPARPAAAFSLGQLEGLPDPVARYFRFALTPGQPPIRSARAEHSGEFRIGGMGAPWKPFTSVEQFATDPPGFVWDAAIRVAPLLTVRVRDSYVRGAGAMQARLAAVVTVADQKGRPELAAGALQRYLAEAVWLPTALLPSRSLVWEAIDNTTARATLSDAGNVVSVEFGFDESGAIVTAYTPERYREVNGAYLPTPWAGSYGSYAEVDGRRVPVEGEVEWILPEGRLPYWRGRIIRIEHQLGS